MEKVRQDQQWKEILAKACAKGRVSIYEAIDILNTDNVKFWSWKATQLFEGEK